jgi:hypothetical protein
MVSWRRPSCSRIAWSAADLRQASFDQCKLGGSASPQSSLRLHSRAFSFLLCYREHRFPRARRDRPAGHQSATTEARWGHPGPAGRQRCRQRRPRRDGVEWAERSGQSRLEWRWWRLGRGWIRNRIRWGGRNQRCLQCMGWSCAGRSDSIWSDAVWTKWVGIVMKPLVM